MSAPSSSQARQARKRWLARGKRLLSLLLFSLVAILLFTLVKNLEWQEVGQALQSFSPATLLLCLAITVVSFCLFGSYDLLGRAYTGHRLPARQIMPVAFVCYAFNLNLTAWIGGVALRYRLYSRLGLDLATITRVLSFALVTNWIGYLMIAGMVFASGLLDLPEYWKVGVTGLQWIGVVLVLAALGYLLACRFARHRAWHFRGHRLSLPSLRLALLQMGLAMLNWSLSSLLVYLLLPSPVNYPTVLGIMLISSIAGVVTHIPAGLGVLETVFIALLQHQASKAAVLAALIGYRAIYLLLPLLVACIVYLLLERQAQALRRHSQAR